jgi:hypothetical protein
MLSLPVVATADVAEAGVAEGADLMGALAVGSADVAVSVPGVALVPAGVGVAATSPLLTPERGASQTQAEMAASERTPRRVKRT